MRIISNDRLIEGEKLDKLPNNTLEELDKKQNKLLEGDNVFIDNSNPLTPTINVVLGRHIDYNILDNRPSINGELIEGNRDLNKNDVGLNLVDNTADNNKPISNDTRDALDELDSKKLDITNFLNHTSDNTNPHNVTKEQLGLTNVDNTSDLDKPISNNTRDEFDQIRVELNEKLDKSSGLRENMTEEGVGAISYISPTGDEELLNITENDIGKSLVIKPGKIVGFESMAMDIIGLEEKEELDYEDEFIINSIEDGGNRKISNLPFDSVFFGNGSDGDLIIEDGEIEELELDKLYQFRKLEIKEGGILTSIHGQGESIYIKAKEVIINGTINLGQKRTLGVNKTFNFGNITFTQFDGMGGNGGNGGFSSGSITTGTGGMGSILYGGGGAGGASIWDSGQGTSGTNGGAGGFPSGNGGGPAQNGGLSAGGGGTFANFSATSVIGKGGNAYGENGESSSISGTRGAVGGGGGAGGAGFGGFNLFISAQKIIINGEVFLNGSNGTKGGNGGSGTAIGTNSLGSGGGGGGGGGGGAGGFLCLKYLNLIDNGVYNFTGGIGGNPGNGGSGSNSHKGGNGTIGTSGTNGGLFFQNLEFNF